jgi:hypothetical protein
MISDPEFKSLCANIARNLSGLRIAAADHAYAQLLEKLPPDHVHEHEADLRDLLERFPKKRKRDLALLLASRLIVGPQRSPTIKIAKPALKVDVALLQSTDEQTGGSTTYPPSIRGFRAALREELRLLSEQHIFQWGTYYRDMVGRLFEYLFVATPPGEFIAVAREEISRHTTEVFTKGYRFVSQRPNSDPVSKSLGGLQGFLALPVETYSTYAFNVRGIKNARRLRVLCSAIISAVLEGYGQLPLGMQTGWDLLSRFSRNWIHAIPFISGKDFQTLVAKLPGSELKVGLRSYAYPALQAVDTLLESLGDDDFCIPRLGQFIPEAQRLEISLSLPRGIEQKRYLEVHCYIDPSRAQRDSLEESIGRGANLIIASLRPDIREWADSHDILRTTLVNAEGDDTATVAQRSVDVLNHELTKFLGAAMHAEPITFNLARTFPLQNPFLARYFLVYRTSVRDLLKTFERDTGVRLWCSVRRSGKSTACFDLAASSSNAIVVNQTMEYTEQWTDANTFAEEFSKALEVGKQLKPSFFRDVVRDCVSNRDAEGAKLILVLDEYETLFERLRLAAKRDAELRYKVVQPLLNQMVGFSRENLLIFIGQRPDSHYILMDQNQLSAYIKQDPFPLFEHTSGRTVTEFLELLRKVLTERVGFDRGFADAVFAETAGHPYLTVNVLVDFFQWMIEDGRRAGELDLHLEDFLKFSDSRLNYDRLRISGEYNFFKNAVVSAISEETRVENPWLHVVYRLLQEIAIKNPDGLECTRDQCETLAAPLLEPLGWDPANLINDASKANFLRGTTSIRPAIPILARIAAISRPRRSN